MEVLESISPFHGSIHHPNACMFPLEWICQPRLQITREGTYAAGVNSKLPCLSKAQGRKSRLYHRRNDLTYPRKEDEHR